MNATYCRRDNPDKYALKWEAITRLFEASRLTYGYRRIALALRREEGVVLSGKVVRRLMKKEGLFVVQRTKRRYSSYVKQDKPPCPNVLARDFRSDRPMEKLVSDVTEFKVAGQRVYLSPLIDLYNGEVIGRSIVTSPTVEFVNKMFEDVACRLSHTRRREAARSHRLCRRNS